MDSIIFLLFLVLATCGLYGVMKLSFYAGQKREESEARRYLESLSHLHRREDD